MKAGDIKSRFRYRIKLSTKLLIYILSITVLIFAAVLTYIIINTRKMALHDAANYVNADTREYANLVQKELNSDMATCRALARAFMGYDEIPREHRKDIYNEMMRNILVDNPQFVSVWASWELNDIDPNYKREHGRERYTYYKEGDEIILKEEVLETNVENVSGLYYDIKADPSETLTDPYFFSYTENTEDQILEASISIPLMEGKNFIGLVGADIELERFHQIVKDIKPYEGSYAIMISSGGKIISHPDKTLTNKMITKSELGQFSDLNITEKISKGEPFNFHFNDNEGKKYYVSFKPFTIGRSDDKWYIGIFAPMDVILQTANKNLLVSLLVGLGGIILLAIIIWLIAKNITTPLKQTTRILRNLLQGKVDKSSSITVKTHDEIGEMADALNTLSRALKANANFANEIGKGNLNQEFTPLSNQDMLGNALLQMRESLLELRTVNDNNHWLHESIVSLSELLQGEKSETELANQILNLLAEILNIQIAAVFIEKEGVYKLTGSYAYHFRKSNANEFKPGQGLVGQAAYEKKKITFTDIPEDYISIKSGLGETQPSNIIVIPLIYQGNVIGVLEIGTAKELSKLMLNFLDQVSENIAIAFNSIKIRNEMKVLLHKTQEQAEELRVQQEELTEANKELEEQTRALKDSQEELQQQQEELRVTNEELEEKTKYLEEQKTEISHKNLKLENARKDLERKAEELEIASKYKSEFLANMSHELRTPLNSLLILSQNLIDNSDNNLTDDQIEAARIIHKSGSDLLNMINDILDLSKIESGKMTLNFEKVSIDSISEDIFNYFKHVTDQKKLKFDIISEKGTPETITTDQQKLEQIIKNFVSNAVKFTKEGGITIKFHPVDPDTDLSRSGLDPSAAIGISVIDSGIGIPKDKQLEIFEAFQQADGSTSRNYGGTGLGLSISRELAKLFGGEIQLESQVNEGSTFTLFIPVKNKEGDSVTSKKVEIKQKSSELQKKKSRAEKQKNKPAPVTDEEFIPDDRDKLENNEDVILIIEDDPNFAKILLKQCHSKDFKCIATPTGEEGYELAKKHNVSAVILDIKLPGINGWQVLDLLKDNSKTRHIPVHIMSGEEETIDAFKRGAIGYLTKPINKKDLDGAFQKLEVFINRKMGNMLLVEDNPELRKSIKMLIGEKDVIITEASKGQQVIDLLQKNTFDCMVLDLGLPDMSGFELIRKLEEKAIEKPPIIVYTGRELSKEENEELQKYTETVIIKGVKSEERLLDETALFLHRMIDKMPEKQQKVIEKLHDKESIFKDKKILLVDDDMRNVFALTKILKEKNMEVLRADNGKTALELLKREKELDLILMDIMMPVMDGYEAIKEIRKSVKFAKLPIIALTAKAMKEDKQKCIDAGANDYLTKPINIDKLLSLMRVWLYK